MKFIVYTLAGRAPGYCRVAMENDRLYIDTPTALPRQFKPLKQQLTELYKEAASKGVSLYGEDVTGGLLGAVGDSISLQSIDPLTNRPVLVEAMDGYTAMSPLGILSFAAADRTAFTIANSLYNTHVNDSGIQTYLIDWASIKSSHRLLLLAIYVATHAGVVEPDYLEAILQADQRSGGSGNSLDWDDLGGLGRRIVL